MSPMRAVIALVLVAAVATAAILMSGGSEEPAAIGESSTAVQEAAAQDRTPGSPPSVSADPEPGGTTRTEAIADTAGATDRGRTEQQQGVGFAVSGRVVDPAGRPVEGAPVQLLPDFHMAAFHGDPGDLMPSMKSASTDASGRFRFDAVDPARPMRVAATPTNLVSVSESIPGARTGDLDVGDLIAQLGGTLTGHVVDQAGNPISGAEVRAWTREESRGGPGMMVFGDPGVASSRSATTDGSGLFRIEGLKPGDVTALAKADGYTRESIQGIEVDAGQIAAPVTITVAPGSSIEGIVVDPNGKPVADAEVSVMETVIDLSEGGFSGELGSSLAETTAADGRFRLSGLKDSIYNVSASKRGFVPTQKPGVDAGTSDLRLTLGRSGVVFGYVRDKSSGDAIKEFDVKVGSDRFYPMSGIIGGGDPVEVLRGARAAALVNMAEDPALFALTDLPSDSVNLRISATGFADFRYGPVNAEGGTQIRVDAHLTPEIVVSGIVYDSQGSPLGGATVALDRASTESVTMEGGMRFERRIAIQDDGHGPELVHGGESLDDTSDDQGRFTIKGVAPGSYSLSARHEEWAPSEPTPLELAEGDRRSDLEVRLLTGGALEGLTYDADGNVMPGARISLKNAPTASAGGSFRSMSLSAGGPPPDLMGGGVKDATSDENGAYKITGIPPGRYLAELTDPDAAPAGGFMFMSIDGAAGKGTPVTIEEGETATADLHLPPTGTVTGLVTEAGNPLADVGVSLKKRGQMIPMGGPSGRTGSNGKFTLNAVEPGDYTLTISPAGAAQPIERDLEVRARETTNEIVTLPTGVITGRVTDIDSGRPIAGVIVDVQADSGSDKPAQLVRRQAFAVMIRDDSSGGGVTSMKFGNEAEQVVTREDGTYEVRFLEPGDYKVEVSGAGIQKTSKDRVRVFEGRRSEAVDFEAMQGATLVIRPQVESGDGPLQFFSVTLKNQTTGDTDNRTEIGQSKMDFDGLSAGTYLVTVRTNNLSGEEVVEIGSGEEKDVNVPLR